MQVQNDNLYASNIKEIYKFIKVAYWIVGKAKEAIC